MLELRDTWLDQIGNEFIVDARGFHNSPAAFAIYKGRYSNSKQLLGHQRAARTQTIHCLQPPHAFDNWCWISAPIPMFGTYLWGRGPRARQRIVLRFMTLHSVAG